MSKLTNADWWFGRTEAQQAKKDQVRTEVAETRAEMKEQREARKNGTSDDAAAKVMRVGKKLTALITLPLLGLAVGGLLGGFIGLVLGVLWAKSMN